MTDRRGQLQEAWREYLQPEPDPRAKEVTFTEDELCVALADGRSVSVPLAWYPRLLHATPDQRAHYELLGEGVGIHWPELDEDLSVAGLLRGANAPGA